VSAFIIPEINRKKAAPYLDYFTAAETKYGLPKDLLNRIAYQESRYDSKVISKAGAIGLMQFMPATAAQFGIDPLNPYESIDAAGKYILQLYNQFKDWKLAIAAYNAGPGNVAKYKGIPPFAETREYVASITRDIGLA
jgi:soluble lytic murein transglycosylase-like protein